MKRQNFGRPTKADVFLWNARSNIGNVTGVAISEEYQDQREAGLIYYCENCKFCHTDKKYFDVDHLVPDKQMRGSENASNVIINAILLCKSLKKGDRGCNQTKGTKLWPPPDAGLARTRPELDMNWMPMSAREANTIWP